MPAYATVRRYMKAQGWIKQPRARTHPRTPGGEAAEHRLHRLEVKHVHALWHLDFHHGSRKILTRTGRWVTPLLLGVLDDPSRLACHGQGYLEETAECLVAKRFRNGLCLGHSGRITAAP